MRYELEVEVEPLDSVNHEATCVFYIEPYNPGGSDEPPSGGYAMLETVRVVGFAVPEEDWPKLGLTEERIAELEEQAAESYTEYVRGLEDDTD